VPEIATGKTGTQYNQMCIYKPGSEHNHYLWQWGLSAIFRLLVFWTWSPAFKRLQRATIYNARSQNILIEGLALPGCWKIRPRRTSIISTPL